MPSYKDHFSRQSADYAIYRPRYPRALYVFLASLCQAHETVWDCGTGNGQAAVPLTEFFQQVIATDPSSAQLEKAAAHPSINYQVAVAEKSPLADASCDLITVAQALHWFNFEAFFNEADRVLKPRGVIAVWTYPMLTSTPAVDAVISHYYHDVVGPYWPPERKWVEVLYQGIKLPYPELTVPPFSMEREWDFNNFVGYFNTWSATQKFIRDTGKNPLPDLEKALRVAWEGEEEQRIKVHWQLHCRAARK